LTLPNVCGAVTSIVSVQFDLHVAADRRSGMVEDPQVGEVGAQLGDDLGRNLGRSAERGARAVGAQDAVT
jgi:hypothetical protein